MIQDVNMENKIDGRQGNIRGKEYYASLRRLTTKLTVHTTSMLMEILTFFSQAVKFFERVYNDSDLPRDRRVWYCLEVYTI